MTYGSIDGFSRMITSLQVTTNNLASTALAHFLKSVKDFGIPSRIRIDGGSEFVHIKTFMEEANGGGRGSFLVGKSVHNQRVERLWRDVFLKVIEKYYNLFCHMENADILSIEDPVQMFALQYVFTPRIQSDLTVWEQAHNAHGLSTENFQSPSQLWFAGSLEHMHKSITAMNNVFRRDISEVRDLSTEFISTRNLVEPDDISIVLPRIQAPLTPDQLQLLIADYDPLGESQHDGADIYGNVVEFVLRCINA